MITSVQNSQIKMKNTANSEVMNCIIQSDITKLWYKSQGTEAPYIYNSTSATLLGTC